MQAEKAVAVQRTCPTCQGQKVINGPTICQVCGQEIPSDDPWWDEETDTLPCGHSVAENMAVQVLTCPECDGHGRTQQWISQAEWQHMQRQKVFRGLGLLVVALLVIFTLVWVVGSRDPDYVCGSWWYGLIPLMLLVWRR